MMPLLDLLGVDRVAVMRPLLASLRAQLVAAVPRLPPATLDTLLERTFPYLAFEELRPVPLAVLAAHAAIPEAYLHQIAAHDEVYSACPLSVKQQVWFADSSVLARELDPLVARYSAAWAWCVGGGSADERQAVVRCVTQLVGVSFEVYCLVIARLYAEYARTGNALLCALRCDVLMGVYGSGVSTVYDSDACHSFVLFLDKCIRDGALAPGVIRELRSTCATLLARTSTADASVALANPRAVALFVREGIKAARDILAAGGHNPYATRASPKNTRTRTRRNTAQQEAAEHESTAEALAAESAEDEPLPQSTLSLVCTLLPLAAEGRVLAGGEEHVVPEGAEHVAELLFHVAASPDLLAPTAEPALAHMLRGSRAARFAFLFHVLNTLSSAAVDTQQLCEAERLVRYALSWKDEELDQVPFFALALAEALKCLIRAESGQDGVPERREALAKAAGAALEGLVVHGKLEAAQAALLETSEACVRAPWFPHDVLGKAMKELAVQCPPWPLVAKSEAEARWRALQQALTAALPSITAAEAHDVCVQLIATIAKMVPPQQD